MWGWKVGSHLGVVGEVLLVVIEIQLANALIKRKQFSLLPVCPTLELLILDDLDPVIVRVKDKRHILHATICQPLLPVYSQILKTLASSIQIVHRDT
jgi:hypothetical protein